MVSSHEIPRTRQFEPEVFLRVGAEAFDRYRDADNRCEDLEAASTDAEFLAGTLCRELLHAANRIDPAITLSRYAASHWQATRSWPVHRGVAYYRLCEIIAGGTDITDVVLASAETGAEHVRLMCTVLSDIDSVRPGSRVLVFSEHSEGLDVWTACRSLLPPGSTMVAAQTLHGQLAEEDIDSLFLKLLQALGTHVRIHLGDSALGRRFWATVRSPPHQESKRVAPHRRTADRGRWAPLRAR